MEEIKDNSTLVSAETNLDTSDKISAMLNGKTVLTVDDEQSILIMLNKLLIRLTKNCNVIASESGDEAISKLQDRRLHPDLIISDLMMPSGTGKDLYDWLLANRPELAGQMIFASGGVSDKLQEFYQNMFREGRLIMKPYTITKFRRCIGNVLFKPTAQEKESAPKSEGEGDEAVSTKIQPDNI